MYPLLESDILICPHNGIINLKSNNGSLLEIEGAGVITQSDLLNASIVGCTNSIAGFPTPCSCIATIPPNAISSMLEVNNEGVILQSQIHTILTDKGFPIQIQTKSPNNEVYLDDSDNLASDIDENPNENRR
ncbi:hypothetical protein CQA53_10810 [Helicobacter didelphidarum]|uniref:Uncharacterized protein n=1 Tax=Helicobacter didelphidarum TaxID=2040648 RepID=A0A3D8I790_9HELI|nr:hypothetical protein [Helicobacter didelphidarum]RDU60604.1 hypothetical protein CQA53_10810 [Helicobacter didelphidarum]